MIEKILDAICRLNGLLIDKFLDKNQTTEKRTDDL
jgi:hypothetical protein